MTQPMKAPMETLDIIRKRMTDILAEKRKIDDLERSLRAYADGSASADSFPCIDVDLMLRSCETTVKDLDRRLDDLRREFDAIQKDMADAVSDPGSDFSTLKSWADLLDGSWFPPRFNPEFRERMESEGIVAFFSQEDDVLESAGAIDDEWYGSLTGTITVCFDNGIVVAVKTEDTSSEVPWTILTDVPSQRFRLINGWGVQCIGAVVSLKDLGKLRGRSI